MPIALNAGQSALLGVVAKQGEAPLTPPYALGENTKRGDWVDLGEHHARQKGGSLCSVTGGSLCTVLGGSVSPLFVPSRAKRHSLRRMRLVKTPSAAFGMILANTTQGGNVQHDTKFITIQPFLVFPIDANSAQTKPKRPAWRCRQAGRSATHSAVCAW